MSSAAPGPSSRSSTWETFAITDVRWLVAAFAWSFLLLGAMAWLPWLFAGYPMVLGASLVAAALTAPLIRGGGAALPASTVVRYALVDASFVAFSIHALFALVRFALAAAGVSSAGGILFFLLPPLVFVPGFYASLAIVGHLRQGSAPSRHLPQVAAAIVAVAFAPGACRRQAELASQERARGAAVAAYEESTGRRVDGTDRLAIGNSLHGFDRRVSALAIDREGRLLVAGGFSYYAGKDARGFARLLPDGRLDESFAARVEGDPASSAPSFVLVAPDGFVVADGDLSDSGPPAPEVARLKLDGTADERFRPMVERAPGPRERIEARGLQPDGGFVFARSARFVSRPGGPCVQRIGPDGAHDAAFESAARDALFGSPKARGEDADCSVAAIDALASGKLLLLGAFPANDRLFGFLRLNPDGTLDTAYRAELGGMAVARTAVGPAGEVFALAQDPVPGSSPPGYRVRCVKIDADGRPDRAFEFSARELRLVDRLVVQPDGKLVMVGTAAEGIESRIVRVLADGRPDPSFRGSLIDGFATTLLVQSDGRIVIGGEFLGVTGPDKGQRRERSNIARLNADGSLDATFDPR